MLALIVLFPTVGFLVNALVGRRLSKAVSGGLACTAVLASFGATLAAFFQMQALPADRRVIDETLFMWIPSGELQVPFAFRFDPLAALMCFVVTGVGFLIHVYSTAYMHEETDGEYARYFSYLNLFAAFMLVLVLGANFLVMFIGWEGVGLCSYLLIGYWFRKQSAIDAGKKAFVVNRIGDMGFILGICLAFVTFGTLDFQEVASRVSGMPAESAFGVLSLLTLLLFIGATGKSAQIPLYVWLPDAMEGPTPVSALIHAATMVTAGVYMIGRTAALFAHAAPTMEIVAIVGALTALLAGTIGLVQNDIKRVLAYSTVSQLGYMFLAMGVGAFAAGIFHLFTHAFFKALMFLGSGAVIHALGGEQDMRRMGGLKAALPVTYWTFLVGALAIAGVPGLSGFFSKDEILFRTYTSGNAWLWVIGIVTAFLTAVYMFRLVYMTFHGPPRWSEAGAGADVAHGGHGHGAHGHGALHPHDAPVAMAIPLVILAIGAVVAGLVGVPHALGGHNRIEAFLEPSFQAAVEWDDHRRPQGLPPLESASRPEGLPPRESTAPQLNPYEPAAEGAAHGAPGQSIDAEHAETRLELSLMGVSIAVALLGILVATYFFLKNRQAAAAMASRFAGLYRLLLNKWYVDELYDALFVQPIKYLSTVGLWKGVDVQLVDGAVNGTGRVVRAWSGSLRLLQTGSVRTYAVLFFAGAVLLVGAYLLR